MDADGSGCLDINEFRSTLEDYRIGVDENEV